MEDPLQYGALGLLALIIIGVLPIVRWVAKGHLEALSRLVATQQELAKRIDESEAACLARIDTMERAIQGNLNETRHSLKNDAMTLGATALAEIREGSGRVLGAVELVRQRVSGLHSAVSTANNPKP